jgi:hypothetical protein
MRSKCSVEASRGSQFPAKQQSLSQLESDAELASRLAAGGDISLKTVREADSGSAIAFVAASSPATSRFDVSFCVVDDASAASYWVNSRFEGSINSMTAPGRLGINSGADAGYGDVALVLAWQRPLSQQEVLAVSSMLQHTFCPPSNQPKALDHPAEESKDVGIQAASTAVNLPTNGLILHLDANVSDPLVFDSKSPTIFWRDLSELGNDAVSTAQSSPPMIVPVPIHSLCYPTTLNLSASSSPSSVNVLRLSSESAMLLPTYR